MLGRSAAIVLLATLAGVSCLGADPIRVGVGGAPGTQAATSALTNPGCTNDAGSLICRFGAPASGFYRIFLDTDRNAATGFALAQGIGADYLVEADGFGYSELYRDNPTAGWLWDPRGAVPFSVAGGFAQFTIARAAIGETAVCAEATDVVLNHDATYSGKITHTYTPACGGGLAITSWQATNSATEITYRLGYGGVPDFFRVWIDTDRNLSTGYVVDGAIGADYLLEADDAGDARIYQDRPGAGWGWDDRGAVPFSIGGGVAQATVDRRTLGETACSGETADLVFDVEASGTRVASAKLTHVYTASCSRDSDPVVLVGSGDIGSSNFSQNATAALLNQVVAANPSTVVMAIGDLAYDSGTTAEFAAYYQSSWGAHKARTRPALGNHEYVTAGAAGYFSYWGGTAGDPSRGYYSYDHGAWHVVVINSNCWAIGGCNAGSPQEQWLRADLAAHPVACTLAYWHHPFVSSGFHHQALTHDAALTAIWQALQDHRADVVVSAHDHDYERLAPIRADRAIDEAAGVRSFIVGTANSGQRPFYAIKPASQARSTGVQGVLKLTLRAGDYDWRFVPIAGQTYADAGTARCH